MKLAADYGGVPPLLISSLLGGPEATPEHLHFCLGGVTSHTQRFSYPATLVSLRDNFDSNK